jgi:hypothetical protein
MMLAPLLLAQVAAAGPAARTAFAWVSGDAAVQTAAEAQLRNRSWDGVIDGVRGFW